MTRHINEIATEIARDWHPVHYTALPYLKAMYSFSGIDERYGLDSARDIVLRFLCNAGTWRGETARRIKTELKAMVK